MMGSRRVRLDILETAYVPMARSVHVQAILSSTFVVAAEIFLAFPAT